MLVGWILQVIDHGAGPGDLGPGPSISLSNQGAGEGSPFFNPSNPPTGMVGIDA